MKDTKKLILTESERDAIVTMIKIANDAMIDYQDIFKLICPKESGPDTIKGDVLLDMVIDFVHRHYNPVEDQDFIVDDRLVNQISSGDYDEAIFTIEHYFERIEK